MRVSSVLVALVILLIAVGCHSLPDWFPCGSVNQAERPYEPPPPPAFAWVDVPYSDTEAFDTLLETYLTTGKPAIRILLATKEPDWSSRLNAWLKAYQAGGKVRQPTGKGGLDQLLWLAGLAQTPTHSREILENAFDRLEQYVKVGAAWWNDEEQRRRRIELVRPYNLDAVRDDRREGNYTILLYNGRYEPGPTDPGKE